MELVRILYRTKAGQIEIVVDAKRTAQDAGTKSLSDRIKQAFLRAQKNFTKNTSGTKSAAAQPKSAVAKKDKDTEKGTAGNARGRKVTVAGRGRGTKRGRNAGRPKRKTADQLDAEMTDYFNTGADTGANGTATTATDADTGMDEIAQSCLEDKTWRAVKKFQVQTNGYCFRQIGRVISRLN